MSNLKNKLNKVAISENIEENGYKITTLVQEKLYTASCDVLTSFENASKDTNFVEYLNLKGLDGNRTLEKLSKLFNELDDLQNVLKDAANKANY